MPLGGNGTAYYHRLRRWARERILTDLQVFKVGLTLPPEAHKQRLAAVRSRAFAGDPTAMGWMVERQALFERLFESNEADFLIRQFVPLPPERLYATRSQGGGAAAAAVAGHVFFRIALLLGLSRRHLPPPLLVQSAFASEASAVLTAAQPPESPLLSTLPTSDYSEMAPQCCSVLPSRLY